MLHSIAERKEWERSEKWLSLTAARQITTKDTICQSVGERQREIHNMGEKMVSEKNGRQSWDHSPIKDKMTQKNYKKI